ncbi:guanine nucleotide-binding protein subunit gamma 3-like [Impatiens glandulifera]|uniref:guanine nucleotide-binding protein subunit gamma 3-like n=1 Tax=Impatiens glandulifera TaxID=253017 RepID=UPI001FB182D2|nr:guanine nucleotide-binding protein subunit gamma 3-like [Impatiens glandulifera]
MTAASGGSSPVLSLPPPRPKSPPAYPDLYGKRRELLKAQMLERDGVYLEEELKFVGGLQPASLGCKEVVEFVTANSDPLMPISQRRSGRRRCRFLKWLRGAICFDLWCIPCSCRCRMPECCCYCGMPWSCGCLSPPGLLRKLDCWSQCCSNCDCNMPSSSTSCKNGCYSKCCTSLSLIIPSLKCPSLLSCKWTCCSCCCYLPKCPKLNFNNCCCCKKIMCWNPFSSCCCFCS